MQQLEISSSGIQSLESTLWMFPCQLLLGYQHFPSNCMASGYICAFNADRSCRAQLLMEHSYAFSHYCLVCVRSTRPRGNHQGLTCVCGQQLEQADFLETPVKYSEQKSEHTNKGFIPHYTPDVIR